MNWRPAPEWESEMEKIWNWSRPAEVLENWRTVAAEHQIPQANRYLQGYEDNLDVLVQDLKETDKNDEDRPHLCRAIWRRKRARRRHVDRQKKLECCEEGRAPPDKAKSKHINWSREIGEEEVPKALSEFYSAIFEFPNTAHGQELRQDEDRKRQWWVNLWRTRLADTPVFRCDTELLEKRIKKLRKHKSSPDGVTAEIFHMLSNSQLTQLAQAITDMFSSLDFETQWTTVAASLVPKKPFPSKLSEFRPISSLSTMRNLLGYVWLAAMGDTQFNSFQTGFLRKTDASHGVFVLERASELAKEWKTPLFLAQLDLKKAFDHVQHSFATAVLQHKGVSDQLISILNKWWTQSSVEVSLAGIKSDKRIAFQRGLPQGAPESPAIFVAVSDYVLGKLDDGWRNRNIGWNMDNIHLTSIAYADDICLLASSKKDLELMVKECIDGFLAAGLETGLDKAFWTSSTHSPITNLKIGEHAIPWTEKITFVGAKIHLCGNSESALTNRIQ